MNLPQENIKQYVACNKQPLYYYWTILGDPGTLHFVNFMKFNIMDYTWDATEHAKAFWMTPTNEYG